MESKAFVAVLHKVWLQNIIKLPY